ncbi:MAG: YkvA family protein [Cyclobacteriaceae bacterium]
MHPKAQEIWNSTKSYIGDNDRIRQVINQAGSKLQEFTDDEEKKGVLIEKVKLVIRMVRAHLNGTYSSFSPKSIFFMVFAVLYFVIPTDMIPDLIPFLGFTDDLTVLYFVTNSIGDDIAAFEEWEDKQNDMEEV